MTIPTETGVDVTESYHDAQARLREIAEEIQKARDYLRYGATYRKHYEKTQERIEELKEERERIKAHWEAK